MPRTTQQAALKVMSCDFFSFLVREGRQGTPFDRSCLRGLNRWRNSGGFK